MLFTELKNIELIKSYMEFSEPIYNFGWFLSAEPPETAGSSIKNILYLPFSFFFYFLLYVSMLINIFIKYV